MTLTRGGRFGSYEIIEPIGAGGMGEVYRARDSRLRRDVALKILPVSVADDPDRIARFEREAQALAALNHPHIAHIYGVEDSQTTTALVLELVDGETLADRLARGPVPIPEAVSVARNIADALESAHAHGILHRDLKPANIKITSAGVLKVLDFGLAKFQHEPVERESLTASTMTSAGTRVGVVLGTTAYMSPEQARGLPVDRRTDIWAFGCVLFEMLAGQPAFTGSSSSDVLAAVLQGEPQWQKLPAGIPPAIAQLLRRCLEKDARRRFHEIADVRIVLEDTPLESLRVVEPPRGRWRTWIPAALLGAAAGAGILAAVRAKPSSPPAESLAFEVMAPAGAELALNQHMAVSPDGRNLAFSALSQGSSEIWIHSFASGTARRLPDTRNAIQPFWSPDGRAVGFFAGGKLRKIDASGATKSVDLCDVTTPREGTWNARDEIVFANVDGPLQRISAGGGSPSPVTRLDASRGAVSHIRPQFLPDGRHVLYTSVGASTEARIVSLDDPSRDVGLGVDGAAIYSAGHLVFYRRGRLLARPFDVASRATTGEPVIVVPRVGEGFIRSILTPFSGSASGVLAYTPYVPAASRLTWFDRSGNRLGTVGDVGEYGTLSLSPDESRLAVAKLDDDSFETNLWVIDLSRARITRITRRGHDLLPRWSPDGQRIVFSSERDQTYSVLMQAPSDGSGEPEVLLKPGVWNWLNDVSRDGRFAVYSADSKDTGADLWIVPLAGDRTPQAFVKTPDSEMGATFSPDGKWVAYVSLRSGRWEVYLRAFPSGTAQRQVSINGGVNPVWRKDGRELFFVAPDRTLMAATISGNQVLEVKKLFSLPSPRAADGHWHQYTVSGDGSRILAIVPEPETTVRTISVIVNWPSRLKQK